MKQERDKEVSGLIETLSRKNALLDIQRVKLKQYEFAVQEAMLFLAKPLKKYEEWMNSETSEDIGFEFAHAIPEKNYQASPLSEAQLSSQTPAKKPTPTHSKSLSTPVTMDHPKIEMTNLEITAIECMRLCFLFLRNCQKSVTAIDNGTYKIPSPLIQDSANESTALSNAPLVITEVAESPRTHQKIINPEKTFTSSIKQKNGIFVEVGEGDLSLEPLEDFKSSMKKPHCDLCRNALLLVDTYKEKLGASEALARDLQGRIEKEVKARKICQNAKDMIDNEIEEITAELFARANQMVVDEAWKMDQLNTLNRDLTKQNQSLLGRLKTKENELAKVTKCLYELQGAHTYSSNYFLTPKSQDGNQELTILETKPDVENKQEREKRLEFSHSIISGFDQFKSAVGGDGFLFLEFQEFMRAVVLSSTQISTQAYQTIHNSIFMKRSMIESIEPCLFYTYQPNSSFKSLGPGLSQSFKKKILDLSVRGHLKVSPIENQVGAIAKAKCMMCTITRECEYKVALGPDTQKVETCTLCRFCRDRIIAVQDFFSFITFLATEKQTSTILSTFKKVIWLKRRIQVAILGNSSLFETELSSILGPGMSGDWENQVSLIY